MGDKRAVTISGRRAVLATTEQRLHCAQWLTEDRCRVVP